MNVLLLKYWRRRTFRYAVVFVRSVEG
jgi:hypothetical protein